MNEMLGPRPESPFSPDQTPQVRGYEYPPFSILHNPAIKQTHELFLSYTPLMDELSAARWLYSLTQFNSEGNLPFGNRFYSFPDNGPLSVPESQQIEPTVGLLIYTSSKLEHALRLQKVNTPE